MALKCKDCCYHWVDEGEEWPMCHFEPDSLFLAPCELEELREYEEVDYD